MNAKNLVLLLVFTGFFSLHAGCATNRTYQLNKIKVGMDKADVLETLGNPTRIARVHGQDRWTYETFPRDANERPSTSYIFFAEGRVTHVDLKGE